MQPFTVFEAIAAPMPEDNVDTDQIIPKQFLTTCGREGLGAGLFHDLRFDGQGRLRDFILNRPHYARAGIIATGANFGCGSSREHAVWALLEWGVRCVIAPSFGEIFETNCCKNGLLPLRLAPRAAQRVVAEASRAPGLFNVDLSGQIVRTPSGAKFGFEIEGGRKRKLVEGLDDITLTLLLENAIAAFENGEGATP